MAGQVFELLVLADLSQNFTDSYIPWTMVNRAYYVDLYHAQLSFRFIGSGPVGYNCLQLGLRGFGFFQFIYGFFFSTSKSRKELFELLKICWLAQKIWAVNFRYLILNRFEKNEAKYLQPKHLSHFFKFKCRCLKFVASGHPQLAHRSNISRVAF